MTTFSTSQTAPSDRTVTRAAVITSFGGPDLLRSEQIALDAPADEQVQIEIAAIAVNPVDLSTRAGLNIPNSDARFPMVLGWDVAGTVVATGTGATIWQIGDRVAAMVFQPIDQRGVYSQYANLDAGQLARVPEELDLQRAATVPLAGLTAAQLLDEALTDGAETLLVDGPLGAVGRSLVTLAVRAGVDVIGVVRPGQAEAAQALGITSTVDRGSFTDAVRQSYPDGVDAAIDLVGGATAWSALDAVRDGGRYATAVPPYIDPTGPFEARRTIEVYVHTVHPDVEQLTELLTLAAQGALPTDIEQTYPLDHASDAHRRQASGGLRGRIVLLP